MVYGSDRATADGLRAFVAGRLLVSDGNLPHIDAQGDFVAGDIRANENIELTAMHALFVREHNWWAERLAVENPSSSDEQLYQAARAMVIAEIQAITFNEFLPALLGDGAIASYEGYDPNVNPGITNEFSTAGYRFGHSLINEDIEFFDRYWYQNIFGGAQLAEIEDTRLSDIVRRNTEVDNLQAGVFQLQSVIHGMVVAATMSTPNTRAVPQARNSFGLAGLRVELLDDEGNVVDDAVTDARGRYAFETFRETGDYQVRVIPLRGPQAETPTVVDALMSRGDLDIEINFVLRSRPANSSESLRPNENAVPHRRRR